MKDNEYFFVHIVQRRVFWFFWLPVSMGSLVECREYIKLKTKTGPRYTFVE